MMSLSRKLKHVWKLVASVLHQSKDLANIFIGSDVFASVLNNLLADDIKIDEAARKGDFYLNIESEYAPPLNIMRAGYDGDRINFIYKSKHFDGQGKRITVIRRVPLDKKAKGAKITSQSLHNKTTKRDKNIREYLCKYLQK